MDLLTQVKNSYMTTEMSKPRKPFVSQDKDFLEHQRALQALSNGQDVPYSATLRIVEHEGGKAPLNPSSKTKSHPGYRRNELGGYFTS